MNKKEIVSDSRIEEIISVLYLIAAGVFFIAEWKILATILLIKAILDAIISIGFAIKEVKQRKPSAKLQEQFEKIEEQFNLFIEKWCEDSFMHLIDNDENDGESFRELLREKALWIQENFIPKKDD